MECCKVINSNDGYINGPFIYPIIFYTGKNDYNYSTNLLDLYLDRESEGMISGKLLPIQLVELNKIPDGELILHPCCYLLTLSMKHIHDDDFHALLKIMFSKHCFGDNKEYIHMAAQYCLSVKNLTWQDFCYIIDEADLPKKYKEEIKLWPWPNLRNEIKEKHRITKRALV